jgi:uncharacterized protein (DUF58 family)
MNGEWKMENGELKNPEILHSPFSILHLPQAMDFGVWYAQIAHRIDLRLRDRMQTLMQGLHPSTFRGRGADFEFLQPHTVGEDLAQIDWKASERLEDGFLVRRRREERVLEVWIAADLSPSIGSGFSLEGCKQRLLLDVVAVIGHAVMQQQDLLGFVGFDSAIRTVLAPFRSIKTFVRLLNTLWHFQPTPGTPTALLSALQFFAARRGSWQHKRLIFILSDFETEEDWLPALQRLRAAHPLHPVFLEETIPEQLLGAAGQLTCRDVETGEWVVVDPRHWLRLLHEYKRQERQRCLTQFEAAGIRALFVSRETFSVDTLIAFLEDQRFS